MNDQTPTKLYYFERPDGTLDEIPYEDGQAVAELLIEHMPNQAIEDALRFFKAHQLKAPAPR